MSKPVVRNAFSRVKSPHPFDPSLPSRVKQEFKDEVNINNIMAKARRGVPPRLNPRTPMYGDFTAGPRTYQDAFEIVSRAEEGFSQLPLEFRREIDNDPRNLFSAPKELWERFGLTRSSPQGKGQAAGAPSGEGDPSEGATSPREAPSGASKKVSKKPSNESVED